MAILVRILVMIAAYALGCLAAAIVMTLGTLAPSWNDLGAIGIHSGEIWSILGLGAGVIGVIALLPALLVLILAEGFGWRSIVGYGLLGCGLALSLRYGLDFAGYVGAPDTTMARQREILAAAGIAGGLVYWLFAGRRAGAWK